MIRSELVEVTREKHHGHRGALFVYSPPLDLGQIEQMVPVRTEGTFRMHTEDATKLFLTDSNTLELFDDSVYVMSDREVGEKLLLRLIEEEGL